MKFAVPARYSFMFTLQSPRMRKKHRLGQLFLKSPRLCRIPSAFPGMRPKRQAKLSVRLPVGLTFLVKVLTILLIFRQKDYH